MEGSKRRGRHKIRLRDNIKDLVGLALAEVLIKAQDRKTWRFSLLDT